MRKGLPRSYDDNLDTSTSSEEESLLTPDLDLLNLRVPIYHDKTRTAAARRRVVVKRSDEESHPPNLLDEFRLLKARNSPENTTKPKSLHKDDLSSNISLQRAASLQCVSGKALHTSKYEHQVTFAETGYSSDERAAHKSDLRFWRKGTPRIIKAIRQHSKKAIPEDKPEPSPRPKGDNSKSSVVVLYHNKLPAPTPDPSSKPKLRVSHSEDSVAQTLSPTFCPPRGKLQSRLQSHAKTAETLPSKTPTRHKRTALRRQRRRTEEIRRNLSIQRNPVELKSVRVQERRCEGQETSSRLSTVALDKSVKDRESSRIAQENAGSLNHRARGRCRPFDKPGCTPRQMAHRANLGRQNSAEPHPFMNGSHNLSYLMQHMQNHPPKENGDSRGLIDVKSDEARRVFPFQATPSGNLKIIPNQVVFESKKVSVLVADPRHTKVNVKAELSRQGVDVGRSGVDASGQEPPPGISHSTANQLQVHQNLSHIEGEYRPRTQPHRSTHHHGEMDQHPSNQGAASHAMPTNDTPLAALGFNGEQPIDWENIILPEKTDLYQELARRITNYKNADCIIRLGHDEFHCHLLVLQSYSTFFDEKNYKEVDLTGSSVTSKAFSIIYDWMISPTCESCHLLRRDNILEIFTAAQYLGVKELEEQCWAFIDNDELFCEDTAFLLYLESRKIGNTAVMELMVPRIMKFFLMLVSTKDFLELSVEELCSLLRSNYICVNSEMEVLMSAVRWLMHDWEGRRQHLLEVLKCVRFGLIAPWQLVDVKRNPENPEFMELMSYPEIQKMVDDGLAFVIIKYWYGNQTEDYYHWIDLLGLTEPTNRNWAGEDKNYVTYREFLLYLEEYQQTRMPELKAPRKPRTKPTPPSSPPKDCPSPPPSRTRAGFTGQNHAPMEGGSSGAIPNNVNNNPGSRNSLSKHPPGMNPPKMPVPAYLPPGTPASMMVPPEILNEYLSSMDRNAKGECKNYENPEIGPETRDHKCNFIEAGEPNAAVYNLQHVMDRPAMFQRIHPEGCVTDEGRLLSNDGIGMEEHHLYCYQQPHLVYTAERKCHHFDQQMQQQLLRRHKKYEVELVESSRSEEEAATTIQAVYRGYKARRRFDEIRKTSSEERQKTKRVAELLAMPIVKNLHKPLEPVKVSAGFNSQRQNSNDLKQQSCPSPRKTKDELLNDNAGQLQAEENERVNSEKDFEGISFDVISPRPTPRGIKKSRQADLQVEKSSTNFIEPINPIETIKSPTFFHGWDERLSSVTPSLNTDTDDPFSPRMVERSTIDLQTTRESLRQSVEFNDEITRTGNNENLPKPKARGVYMQSVSGFNSQLSQRMSLSLLGSHSKHYYQQNSLFYPDRESVLVLGGIDTHEEYGCTGNTGKDMYRFKPEENSWEFVGEIPEPRHHHSVVYLKGRVYLVGGADPREDDIQKKSPVVGTVWSYDPAGRIWFNEPGMLTPRQNFSLVVSHGKMFAIGGQDRNGMALRTVESFDPIECVWRKVRPMFTARIGPASAKYQNRIWVAGGMTKSKKEPLSREVECYDPLENLWLKAAALRSPRCFASMYVVSGCLYVIGGAGKSPKVENGTESIDSIDVWDQDGCTWCLQASMAIARHGHSTSYIGGQLLIIGGVTTVYMGTLKSVECYCCERANWIKGVASLPYAISGHGSVSLPPVNLLLEP
ncbi:uncharacterized protein LOC124294665 [Neodiprion lecontei]|uniref:Uncharacterized protein LOC124294665 n=1 Tax=Neodiprion lecontei TaxID=441921 RepID=A0ABM3G9P3_NEOLC|nr:uncharacterized protein LOC124294665 [Neodiprion lecontei]